MYYKVTYWHEDATAEVKRFSTMSYALAFVMNETNTVMSKALGKYGNGYEEREYIKSLDEERGIAVRGFRFDITVCEEKL